MQPGIGALFFLRLFGHLSSPAFFTRPAMLTGVLIGTLCIHSPRSSFNAHCCAHRYFAVVIGALCLLCGLPCLLCYCCGRANARTDQYTAVAVAGPSVSSPGYHAPHQQPAGWQQPNAQQPAGWQQPYAQQPAGWQQPHPYQHPASTPLFSPMPSAPTNPGMASESAEAPPSYDTFQK